MTWASVIQQLVQHVQFIGMLSSLDIKWPEEWNEFLNVLSFANLDPNFIVGQRKVPVITMRMIFIFVSICVPILINVFLLLIFQPATLVLWYLALSSGVCLFLAGLVAALLPDSGVQQSYSPTSFVALGLVLIFGCLLALCIKKIRDHRHEQQMLAEGVDREDIEAEIMEESEKWYRRFHRKRSFLHLCLGLLLALIGILFLGIVDVKLPGNQSTKSWFSGPVFLILGFVALGCSGAVLLFMAFNLCRCGRVGLQKVGKFMKDHLLMLLLMFVGMSYIPTLQYAVNVYMCAEYSCPPGKSFNPHAQRPVNSFDRSQARFCDVCNIDPSSQCGNANDPNFVYCPGFVGSRSWRNPDVPCDDEATVYFMIAATIAILNYSLGIPLLFFKVIRYLTKMIVLHADVAPPLPEETEDDVWKRQMYAIEPVAATLYDPFCYSRRFYLLITMAHRVLITFTLNVAAAYSNAAAALVLLFHGIACIVVISFKPFLHRAEQTLAVALAICNVINGLFAVIVWRQGSKSTPGWTTAIFVLINGIIPAVGAAIIAFKARKDRRKTGRELERRARDPTAYDAEMERRKEAERLGKEVDNSPDAPTIAKSSVFEKETEEEKLAKMDPYHRAQYLEMKETIAMRKAHNEAQTKVFNEHSTMDMNKAFMGMGIFFTIALGVAFLGVMRTKESEFVVSSDPLHMHADYSLAGYANWTDFTSHCCCINQSTPSLDFNETERWICGNGKTVERGRVTKDRADNGLPLRPLCGMMFRRGCALVVAANRYPTLTCSDATTAEIGNTVTPAAKTYYW